MALSVMKVRIFFYFLISTLARASKCPEPRKPHPTSCIIFYNCVNLPDGGYVWAPAKCTEGLVFQPYLRMCVLPGDSWSCESTSKSQFITKPYEIPELMNPTQTSYLGYKDDIEGFSEQIDSSYLTGDLSDAMDHRLMATPYPLIEVTEPSLHNDYSDIDINKTIRNIGVPIAIKHSEDNYLYRFVNGQQQILLPPGGGHKTQLEDHLKWLSTLVDRLLANQGLGIPLDRQIQMTLSPISSTTTASVESALLTNNYRVEAQRAALLNYLVRNNFIKNNLPDTESPMTQTNRKTGESIAVPTKSTTPSSAIIENDEENPLDILINGPKAANNVIVVRNSLGVAQYVTIDKYKSIAKQLTTETVELLPCTKGVRLPNDTDCTKYYRCDPKAASVTKFSCPQNTAFNDYTRVCDIHKYKSCITDALNPYPLKISATTRRSELLDSALQDDTLESNPCRTIGKYGDPLSESHYYLCYSGMGRSAEIMSVRMACPNDLIFCREKKICTTKQRCHS